MFVDSFHFALQMHLTPNSFGIKNELIPLTCLGLGLGKGDKVMEKDQVQRKTPQVSKFCFGLISPTTKFTKSKGFLKNVCSAYTHRSFQNPRERFKWEKAGPTDSKPSSV